MISLYDFDSSISIPSYYFVFLLHLSGLCIIIEKVHMIGDFLCEKPSNIFSRHLLNTVNSRLADTPVLRTLAITDKIQIPIYRGLTENDSRYYGLSLFWTQNDVRQVSAITRVDCIVFRLPERRLQRISSYQITNISPIFTMNYYNLSSSFKG